MHFFAQEFFQILYPRGDDDFVDRINYYYTAIILTISAVLVTANLYVGQPIQCWLAEEFGNQKAEYIETLCWLQNTYWVPMHKNIPDDIQTREDRQIGYYQWVPFILMAEAIMFCVPMILWRLLNWQTGLNLHIVIDAAAKIAEKDSTEREKTVESVAMSLTQMLDLQTGIQECRKKNFLLDRLSGKKRCVRMWKRFNRYTGSFVTLLYLMVKFLYTVNVVLQFLLLNTFLKAKGADSYLYGFQVLSDLIHGRQWQESGHFPRITICDVDVRYLGNTNRFSFQCTLVVNIFNEKIFALLWCWFLLVAVITCASWFFWVFITVFTPKRTGFVLKYVDLAAEQAKGPEKTFYITPVFMYDRFVLDFLNVDGIFALRMLANHAGDFVTLQVIKLLWKEYRHRDGYLINASDDSLRGMNFKSDKTGLIADSTFVLMQPDCEIKV